MARRDNGTGTVYQRPNGSLRAESTREGEQTETQMRIIMNSKRIPSGCADCVYCKAVLCQPVFEYGCERICSKLTRKDKKLHLQSFKCTNIFGIL